MLISISHYQLMYNSLSNNLWHCLVMYGLINLCMAILFSLLWRSVGHFNQCLGLFQSTYGIVGHCVMSRCQWQQNKLFTQQECQQNKKERKVDMWLIGWGRGGYVCVRLEAFQELWMEHFHFFQLFMKMIYGCGKEVLWRWW